MKNVYRMYLLENMEESTRYILDNAVLIALCVEEAKSILKENWPELDKVEIIELSQNYISQLATVFSEEKILCVGVINE